MKFNSLFGFPLLSLLFHLTSAAIVHEDLLADLEAVGWQTASTDGHNITTLIKSYHIGQDALNATVRVGFSGDGDGITSWAGIDASSRSVFSKDLRHILSSPASHTSGGGGAHQLRAVTCPSTCPVWVCSYREKYTWNVGCVGLWGNPGFGYWVRYRKGRCAKGGYGCNSCAWWADYQGNIANCPACETEKSTTLLDCNWP